VTRYVVTGIEIVRSSSYRVETYVKEVGGCCTMGYKPGDYSLVEKYYL